MTTPPRVLIITRYFPPLDSIATIRMFSWAKYLHRRGWDVSVLTTSKDKQMVTPLELDTSKFNVTEVPYFDPITFLGFDKKQEASKGKATKKKSNAIKNWIMRFYRERMNERMPGRTDFWIAPAIRELRRRKAEGEHYDFVISSYGPPSAHIVGHYASKIFDAYWIADYRDLWLENHIYLGLWPFTKIEGHLEKKIVSRAHIITTVSEGLKNALEKKFYPVPVYILENGFDPEIIDPASDTYYSGQEKKIRIVYTGSLYFKRRDPSALFQAVQELLKDGKLAANALEILFYGSSIGNLLELIEKYDLQNVAKYCGTVSLQDSYSIQKSADALLFLETPNPTLDGILTGKLFEYMYVKAPIIAVGVNRECAPARLIEETESGTVCGNNVPLIKEVIIKLVNGQFVVNKKRDLIMQYTRENRADKLMQLMR